MPSQPELYHSFPFKKRTPSNILTMHSLFSNNSVVYYKPGSLASGGVGSVVNSTAKSRKT